MQVLVTACDKYSWCLRPFSYLFNTFWSPFTPVTIGGYAPPGFDLPANFTFHSISPDCYPAEKWSNGVIEFFQSIPDPFFVWMLEDYWLIRDVDLLAVELLGSYMQLHPDVLRIDLTGDRLYSTHAKDIGMWGHLDLIETTHEVQYQLSTQAALINRERILEIMKPDLSPWDYELQESAKVIPDGLRVLGTRQCPVRYTIGLGTGAEGVRTEGIPEQYVDELNRREWLDAQD